MAARSQQLQEGRQVLVSRFSLHDVDGVAGHGRQVPVLRPRQCGWPRSGDLDSGSCFRVHGSGYETARALWQGRIQDLREGDKLLRTGLSETAQLYAVTAVCIESRGHT